MPRRTPTTKEGKKRAVATVMREFKGGTLKSSSGQKVTKRSQAIAIAMSESNQGKSKKKSSPKSRSKTKKKPAKKTRKKK